MKSMNNRVVTLLNLIKDKELRKQRKAEKKRLKQEKYYLASQWKLMSIKLAKHKLAMLSIVILVFMYLNAIFGGFVAPQGLENYSASYSNAPPTKLHFFHEGKYMGPFVYGNKYVYDEFEMKHFAEDKTIPYKIKLFVKGTKYKLFGFIESDRHLF